VVDGFMTDRCGRRSNRVDERGRARDEGSMNRQRVLLSRL
jgi:hypothetical protein